MVKRGFDIVVSALLLLLAFPLFILVALLVSITSSGPVLFRQVRMGRGFKPFFIVKFRTMHHADGGFPFTFGADPRITPLGGFLRRSKLDELPQLWNVLCGEMSLVGPRPVLPELTDEFRSHYLLLLRVRPGLTDPASLKYCQEASLIGRARDGLAYFKTVITPDKIRLSLEYMERANFWTDLMTLAMTGVVCVVPAASRMYGPVPQWSVERNRPGFQATESPIATRAMDSAIFHPEAAMQEALTELPTEVETMPWILSRLPLTGTQSTSTRPGRRAS